MVSETSDYGYGTQMDHPGTMSTSSNEDEPQKLVHQKPHHLKQKPKTKIRIGGASVQDRKRKKIFKRAKAPIIVHVQGLSRKTPTDEDIANILKEFTVEFLLKGYNSLVSTLHNQILTNVDLEIDTAHFFWLLTYFLKFATQIELDLEHLKSVLSFDIVAYLTAEGVNLCEEFELALKVNGSDLKPTIRRTHLVVTATREFVQAIDVYSKRAQSSADKHEPLEQLQTKLCEADELRQLLVLLLRHYDAAHHRKPYLQDLIVTNHILLVLIQNTLNLPDYKGKTDMVDHIKQFATTEMMHQYAVLLEDYSHNGDFVNDCIFNVMHHVGGEVETSIALIQPKILKIFSAIWNSDFELCDDWTDLINYVIYASTRRTSASQCAAFVLLGFLEDPDGPFVNPPPSSAAAVCLCDADDKDSDYGNDRWADAELSSLSWHFMQCNMSQDMIGDIVKLFKEDSIIKSRDSVIKELYKQNLIEKSDYESLLKTEFDTYSKASQQTKETRNNEIGQLCEELIQDGKLRFLEWVQKALLDTCFAKIYIERKAAENTYSELQFECFKQKHVDLPQISPVCYHNLLMNKSVPLVTWNLEQASICKNVKFLQLVNDLGLHMPLDSGKMFIRIPHFWTADFLYEVAGMIMPIDTKKLRFSKNDILRDGIFNQPQKNRFTLADDVMCKDATYTSSSENYYQIHKQNHNATMANFSTMPGLSFEGVNNSAEANKINWLEIVQRTQELNTGMQVKKPVMSFEEGFNNTAEIDKRNWLEIVQRSQELKIAMQIKKSGMSFEGGANNSAVAKKRSWLEVVQRSQELNIGMQVKNEMKIEPKTSPPSCIAGMFEQMSRVAAAATTVTKADSIVPPLMSSYDPQPAEDKVIVDDEDTSVFETASVASDLTRMYVSDEDEKPSAGGAGDIDSVTDQDSGCCSHTKRPRVIF